MGPYPFTVPGGNQYRVTVEEAPVTFPHPDSPLLQYPNHIGPKDFDGWVQERALYVATKWDKRYQTVMASHDPGEESHRGRRIVDALRQRRLHFHGVFLVPAIAGGCAGRVPPVRQSAAARSKPPISGFAKTAPLVRWCSSASPGAILRWRGPP
jgi:hypothetical protein